MKKRMRVNYNSRNHRQWNSYDNNMAFESYQLCGNCVDFHGIVLSCGTCIDS